MRLLLLFLLLLSVGTFPTCSQPFRGQVSVPRFLPSTKPPVAASKKTPYEFGYLEVPENRTRPTGKTIKLPVYIFKSRSKNPAPDPVLYLVGGPGSSALNAVPYMQYYRYLDDRDFIVLEQRGTAYAQPHLACPEWAEVMPESTKKGLSAPVIASAYVTAARNCRDRLRGQGIDLEAYRSREIAADVEDLRKVLKIDQLNLLTLSYGTKIAQILLRDYPESIRSAVLDGPLPLDVRYDESSVTNLYNLYETLFRDCASDPTCQQKHPRLRERFYAYLSRLTEQPLVLDISTPDGKSSFPYRIKGKDVFQLLGRAGTAEIPQVLDKMEGLLEGDNSLLFAAGLGRLEPGSGAGLGMRLSVWCAEELAFAKPERITQERRHYPAIDGANPTVFSYEVCQAWDVRPEPTRQAEPIRSKVPTLLLSGGYDPITPPVWGERLLKGLPNGHHLIFPGWTHGVTTYWDKPCGMDVARAFFNDPREKPVAQCLTDLPPVRFE